MKVFMVFAALLLAGAGFMGYQGDLNRYVHAQMVLKEACEECASAAALFINEEAYAEGLIVFDREKGRSYAEEYLDMLLSKRRSIETKDAVIRLKFKDDASNDFSFTEAEYAYDTAAVSCEIELETGDLFGSPFISVTSLRRRACYELRTL